jgi:hypothetical protein
MEATLDQLLSQVAFAAGGGLAAGDISGSNQVN